uniref:Uncharacterized protein n=1 Tax=Timema douglasi TaxID=61478 RepID=A0A7R8VTS7_TIMDO|nr:unnamed protein product [Timema douglasi]
MNFDTDTKDDMDTTIKSEPDNYKCLPVKKEHLLDAFPTISEEIKVETNTQEDVDVAIKFEPDSCKSCHLKLERLSDNFITIRTKFKFFGLGYIVLYTCISATSVSRSLLSQPGVLVVARSIESVAGSTAKHQGNLNLPHLPVQAKGGSKCWEHGGTRARKTCKEKECSKQALGGGRCIKHGGTQNRKLCKEEGCSKQAKGGGKCIKHGGTRAIKKCKEEGCPEKALGGGKCVKHGGTQKRKTCNEESCSKQAKVGGKCIKHGGNQNMKTCNEERCSKQAKVGGKCIKHGGSQNRKTCKEEGCSKHAKIGGKCMKHGGTQNKKTCKEEQCSKQALGGAGKSAPCMYPPRTSPQNTLHRSSWRENLNEDTKCHVTLFAYPRVDDAAQALKLGGTSDKCYHVCLPNPSQSSSRRCAQASMRGPFLTS